jgi:hypothetical protein
VALITAAVVVAVVEADRLLPVVVLRHTMVGLAERRRTAPLAAPEGPEAITEVPARTALAAAVAVANMAPPSMVALVITVLNGIAPTARAVVVAVVAVVAATRW